MNLSKNNLDIFEKEGVLLLEFILSAIEVKKLRDECSRLAVSESDKQDIEWENIGTDNEKFEKN